MIEMESEFIGSRYIHYDIKVETSTRNIIRTFTPHRLIPSVGSVVSNLLSCIRRGYKLVYTRNRSTPKSPKGITVYQIINAIDHLEKNGYIHNFLGCSGKTIESRVTSYIIPTEKFVNTFVGSLREVRESVTRLIEEHSYIRDVPVIELRNSKKEPIDFRVTKDVRRMMQTVKSLNEVNDNWEILNGDGQHLSNVYCRVFNEDWENGGRYYRADVLSIKNRESKGRLDITIGGESVIEVDFSCLHFRIAAALMGLDSRDVPNDVYENVKGVETGVDRKIVKLAVNILFNTKSKRSAIMALNSEISSLTEEEMGRYNLGGGSSVINLVLSSYSIFDRFMHKGWGSRFQWMDSELATGVLTPFISLEKPILPVHDSFITRECDIDLLLHSMGDGFRELFSVDWEVPVTLERKNGNEYEKIRLVV